MDSRGGTVRRRPGRLSTRGSWALLWVRMRAWEWEIALAQMSRTPKLTRIDDVRMLASRSDPMPTTARSNSWTESWRNASSLVESACTTWVRRPARDWTVLGLSSIPSTSVPSSTSSSARDLPNLPSPTTTTPDELPGRSSHDVLRCLANDRSPCAFVGLPAAAAIFDSGDQIADMAEMVGYGTFVVEHLIFGLVLGLGLAWRGRGARTH